jgi:hypothetical protein
MTSKPARAQLFAVITDQQPVPTRSAKTIDDGRSFFSQVFNLRAFSRLLRFYSLEGFSFWCTVVAQMNFHYVAIL